MNRSQLVRQTCRWVSERSSHVKIDQSKIPEIASLFQLHKFDQVSLPQSPAEIEQTLTYIFLLDSLNFCFWPLPNFQYHNLIQKVESCIKNGMNVHKMAEMSQQNFKKQLLDLPPADQRARIIRQVGSVTLSRFEGLFSNVVRQADGSVVKLLNLLVQNYPNFQDHSIYKGHQIHFYKRAQILIGDIWKRLGGKGLGHFTDIDQLTMFPDYRVPQILHHHGVFVYSQPLKNAIYNQQVLESRDYQCELRANSVVAAELIQKHLKEKGINVIDIQVDWFLWNLGESNLSKLKPHHRIMTIYY